MSDEKQAYKGIFKYTFLFGFVQIVNIFAKILLNKAAAIFLGTGGIGVIGIFQSTADMLKTFFSLGISQSAVRDISKANKDGNEEEFSQIITITHKIIWFTSLAGALFTVVFSSYLSVWSFGNDSYTSLFILLAVVIFLNILADGQLGILKGMRQLKDLAKATIFGSFAGLVSGIPFYYFLKNDGIVPTLLAVAVSLIIFSTYYVKKIKYKKVNVSVKEIVDKSSSMVQMGIALMFVTFVGMLSQYYIKIYVGNTASLSVVGIYQAGLTMVSGYFGIVISAMMTDYYPRISAIYDDNEKLIEEMNKQTKVGLILVTPLIVAFIFLMPFFVQFLYSNDFIMATEYMRYAIFWTLIIIVSNPIDMILIAKQNTKMFLFATIVYRGLGILISIYGFNSYGIEGLGIAMMIMGIIHIVLVQSIMYKLYNILIDFKTLTMFLVSLVLVVIALLVSDIDSLYLKYFLGLVLLIISVIYSMRHFNSVTGLSITNFIKSKFKRRK